MKWAGGKSKQLDVFAARFPSPTTITAYYEPFFGGGVVGLHLYAGKVPAFFSDKNAGLIEMWQVLRDEPEALAAELARLEESFRVSRLETFQKLYRKLRDQVDPATLSRVARAARFIALNRGGMNGLFRVNQEGRFNVPPGNWTKPDGSFRPPRLIFGEHFWAASRRLQSAVIEVHSALDAIRRADRGSFVYADPPYVPRALDSVAPPTSSFVGYTADGFNLDDQRALAAELRAADRRGVRFAASNHDLPIVRQMYAGFRMETIGAPRSINSKGTGRGLVRELLISNLP